MPRKKSQAKQNSQEFPLPKVWGFGTTNSSNKPRALAVAGKVQHIAMGISDEDELRELLTSDYEMDVRTNKRGTTIFYSRKDDVVELDEAFVATADRIRDPNSVRGAQNADYDNTPILDAVAARLQA